MARKRAGIKNTLIVESIFVPSVADIRDQPLEGLDPRLKWRATSFANDVAGARGIEPMLTVLETVVLPLYEAPKGIFAPRA